MAKNFVDIPTVRFNNNKEADFFKVLRKRVGSYFKDKSRSRYADARMKFKTIFMIGLYFIPMAILITGFVETVSVSYLLWMIMALGMGGIGLSVMHDANHGSYSKSKSVNKVLGYLANFLGAYHRNWKIQHNRLHHSYTNIEGYDEDIMNKIMRFSPYQKRKPYHKYQIIYGPLAYGLATLYWFVGKDFDTLKRFAKSGLFDTTGISKDRALLEIICYKVGYLILTVLIPLYTTSLPWYHTILGFLAMQYTCGLILTLVFQPAHVIDETEFYLPEVNGAIDNNWAIHQMKTTSNFANRNRLLTWYIGGLNFQVEHHLFPNICHIHYRDIAPIVKETAKEFGVPYLEHQTFRSALISHFKVLKNLGTGEYDKRLHPAA
jgi:linoleoyl-CoA desaturase